MKPLEDLPCNPCNPCSGSRNTTILIIAYHSICFIAWWTIDGPCRSNDVKCKALGPADVCPMDNFITQGDHRSLNLWIRPGRKDHWCAATGKNGDRDFPVISTWDSCWYRINLGKKLFYIDGSYSSFVWVLAATKESNQGGYWSRLIASMFWIILLSKLCATIFHYLKMYMLVIWNIEN